MSQMKKLPQGWAEARVADIGILVRGVSYDKSSASNEPRVGYIPVLRATNIQDEHLVTDADLVYVPDKYVKSEQLLEPGDIVVCMSSGSKNLVGKAARLSQSWHGAFGAFCAALRFHPMLDVRYLSHFFSAPQYRGFIHQQSSGININNLRHGDIEQLLIPVAPLAEQQRIVETIEQHFTRLDAGVAALKRAQAALKRYRAAVLQAAVEGKLTAVWRAAHPDVEPASELLKRILAERRARWEADMRAKGKEPEKVRYVEPEAADATNLPELLGGWCWASVEQLTTYIGNGLSPKPASDPPGHRILRINAVRPMRINMDEIRYLRLPTEEVMRYFLEDGDILFTRYNGSLGLLGVAGMVRDVVKPTLHPDKLIRVRTIQTVVLPAYLELASNTGHSRAHIESRARTTAGQTGISGADIKQMPLPLPPLPEQEQIVVEVEQRLSVVSTLEATIEANLKRAERLRQSILERAFAGKLVPQFPDDEPAGMLLERLRQERVSQCDTPRKRREQTAIAATFARSLGSTVIQQDGLWHV